MKGFGLLAGVVVMVMLSVIINTQLAFTASDIDKGLKDLTREDKIVDFVELENQDEYVFNKYDALFMLMNNIEDPNFVLKIDSITLEYSGFKEDMPPAEIFKQIASTQSFISLPENALYKYTQSVKNHNGKDVKYIEFIRK